VTRGAGPVRAFAAVLAATLGAVAPCAGQPNAESPVLRHEFSCALERRPGSEGAVAVGPEEAGARLRAEAAWVYMGMIHGFEVEYVPLDIGRNVHESFAARPAWNQRSERKGLSLADIRIEETTVKAYVEYRMTRSESSRYAGWRARGAAPFQAEGRAAEANGPDARFTAMEQAVKLAVKEYARSLEKNRPRRVRALAAFERPPTIKVDQGLYVATARILIKVLEIQPYPDL